MNKERKIPTWARVFGVTAIGLAAACGGKMAKNEIAGKAPVTSTPQVESQIPQPRNVEQPPISQEVNLIPDPSFESGDWRNNWLFSDINPATSESQPPSNLAIDNSEAHSGTSSLHLTVLYRPEILDPNGYTKECEPGEFHYLTFNSEIQLPPGFYQTGMWVKIRSTEQPNVPIGILLSLADQNFKVASFADDPAWPGTTRLPTDWKLVSTFIQIPQESATLTLRPQIIVSAPISLPCGAKFDIWFDDIYLIPAANVPSEQEVHVLSIPEEIFWKKIEQKTQPLVDKAQPLLSKVDDWTARRVIDGLTGTPEVGDVTKDEKFHFLLDALAGLFQNYNKQQNTSPVNAQEFLNLAKDICQLVKENFSAEFENERHNLPTNPCFNWE